MENLPTRVPDRSSFDRLVYETRQLSDPAEAANLLQIRVLKAFIDRVRKDSKKPVSSNQQDKELSRKRVFEKGETSNERKKQKKITTRKNEKKKLEDECLKVPEYLSSDLVEKIAKEGGTHVQLVITKPVYKTDLNTHHDRLTIPEKKVKAGCTFLTEEEKKAVCVRGKTLDVKLIEPCGAVSDLKFIRWKLKKSYSYALRTSWNDVLKRNKNKHFKLHDIIQLWSFRVDEQLWFSLQKVRDAP